MTTPKKILTAPLRIAIALVIFGIAAKIMEWPHALPIVLIGLLSLMSLYTIRFWKKPEKHFLDYVKLLLVLCWTTNGLIRMLHFPYTDIFQSITALCFITWFVLEGTTYFKYLDTGGVKNTLRIWWNIAMVLGTICILLGGLLKILGWDYANVLLISGIAVVALYIFRDIFVVPKMDDPDSGNEELLL